LTLPKDAPPCPHCHQPHPHRWGTRTVDDQHGKITLTVQRDRCRACKRTSTVVRREPTHNRGAAWLIQAIARGAMRNREGEIVKPLQGAQILHDWRCLIHPWKERDAWFLRSIAECLSFAQRHDEAVETSLSTLRLAQQSNLPVEIHLAQHAAAYVLLLANRPEESLAYLSVFPHQHPVNQVEDALLWHQILLALEERADSLTWLERARQLVEQHHLIRYQTKLAQLEQAFSLRQRMSRNHDTARSKKHSQ
jgi:hypothetical protein